jgi:hypothetical protein
VYGVQSVAAPLGATSVCLPSHDAASFGTHCDIAVSHVNFASQSAALVQPVAHAVAAQTYGEHVEVTGAWHCPLPSQLPRAVATPFAHEAGRQFVFGPTNPSHVPRAMPSHVAVLHTSVDDAEQAGRPFAGLPTTGAHVPSSPARLHASHCPVHLALQQTPSTQKGASLAHAADEAHDLPCGTRATHALAEQ